MEKVGHAVLDIVNLFSSFLRKGRLDMKVAVRICREVFGGRVR